MSVGWELDIEGINILGFLFPLRRMNELLRVKVGSWKA